VKNKIKIITIILPVSLALVGFFYFLKIDKKVIVSEREALIKDEESLSLDKKDSTDMKNDADKIDEKTEEELVNKDKELENKEVYDTIKNSKGDDDMDENYLKIVKSLVSWGFEKSNDRNIDTIILHTSYNILGGDEYDFEKVKKEYRDYQVSPHYVIDREGKIFQLVEDKNIAYHAGESKTPDGRKGVNNFSIGIEILNNEKDNFTVNQYEATNELILDLRDKYEIKYVLGHNQIAPGRKTDPWNINWDKINK